MKSCCLLLLLLLFGRSGVAQTTGRSVPADSGATAPVALPARVRVPSRTSYGFKVGGALSTKRGVRVPIAPATGFLPGAVVGVYRVVPLGSAYRPVAFQVQTELLASMLGHRLTNPSTQYEGRLHHFYVSVPVLLTASYRRFFLGAGVQASYLVAVRERYTFAPNRVPGRTVEYRKDPEGYNRYEVAYVAGAGYRWPVGLGVEFRYVGGLTNLFAKNSYLLYASDSGQYTAGLHVQLSYPFGK